MKPISDGESGWGRGGGGRQRESEKEKCVCERDRGVRMIELRGTVLKC